MQPEPKEYLAAVQPVCRERQCLKPSLPEYKPVDRAIVHSPDDVLLHPVSTVHVQLNVQVITRTARRNFCCQFRRALYVPAGTELCLPTAFWQDIEEGVRLRLVVQVQPNRTLFSASNT